VKPSAFAPLGLLQPKSGTPAAEKLHATIVGLLSDGSEFALASDVGSFVDCFSFALARSLAKVQLRQEKLDRSRLAAGAYELLDALEEEFGLTPAPTDTLRTRRRALAAAMKVVLGSRRTVLEQALSDLLGDDYVGLHVQSTGEVSIWPSALGDDPQLLLVPDAPRKLVSLVTAISTDLGSPQQVRYTPIDPNPDVGHTLTVGDRLVVEPEILGRAEAVTVESLAIGDPELYFTATFEQAHEPSAMAAQMPFPAWGSSQRHLLVALSSTAAVDAEKRRKTHELLARTVTGVTTWSICPASGASQCGPWTLDDPLFGRLDCNPMAIVSVP
jgi:hypothetical protein